MKTLSFIIFCFWAAFSDMLGTYYYVYVTVRDAA